MLDMMKILVLVSAVAWGSVHAQPVTYDLPALERLAVQSSRTLQAARSQVDAARYAIESASAFPNPDIEFASGSARARVPGANPGDVKSYALSQPLDMPWSRNARIDAAEAGYNLVTENVRVFEADFRTRLRLRFFDVLRRESELRNAREDAALMESVRGRIQVRVETGEAPRFELLKAEAEAMNAQKNSQAAAIRVDQARALLRQIVGDAMPAQYKLEGSLRSVPELPDLDVLKSELLRQSPDLARSRAETEFAERRLNYEKSRRWPTFALKAGVDQEPDMRTSRIGLSVTVPLWDRRSGPIGEAAAQVVRARHEQAGQVFALGQSLETAYQQYEIARAQVASLESGIVRRAENALQVAEAAYRFGERGFIEVLDAQRVYRAARAELITARYELAAAWVEIERLRAAAGENKE
jgi:cobalt-zinc-cadmium efflux system outer membrane protein